MIYFVMLLVFGSVPLVAVTWVRWRFAPARMRANADRLLADTEARLEKHSDAELRAFLREHRYLNGPVAGSAPARRVVMLLDGNQLEVLAREWGDLSQALAAVEAERAPKKKPVMLDYALEIDVAIRLLAARR